MWKLKTSFSTVSVIYFLMQQTIFCCEMYFYLLVEGWKKKKKMVLYISRAKIASIPTKISEKYFHPRKLHPWILTRNNTKTFSLENHLFFFSHKEREGHCYNLFTRSSLQFLSNWIPVLGSKLFDELPEFFIFGGPPVTSRAALRLIWACLGLLLHGLYTSETWKLFDLLH